MWEKCICRDFLKNKLIPIHIESIFVTYAGIEKVKTKKSDLKMSLWNCFTGNCILAFICFKLIFVCTVVKIAHNHAWSLIAFAESKWIIVGNKKSPQMKPLDSHNFDKLDIQIPKHFSGIIFPLLNIDFDLTHSAGSVSSLESWITPGPPSALEGLRLSKIATPVAHRFMRFIFMRMLLFCREAENKSADFFEFFYYTIHFPRTSYDFAEWFRL